MAGLVVLGLAMPLFGGLAAGTAAAAGDPGLWYFDDYKVQDAHDAGFKGQGVKLAILDSPVDTSVPALSSANLTVHEPGYCEVPDQAGVREQAVNKVDAQHGTTMASLVAGNGKSADGGPAPLGVAPDAQILYYATSFEQATGAEDALGTQAHIYCYRDGVIGDGADTGVPEAIDQAVADGADIISMSFGASQTDALSAAIARAVKAGVILVASVANDESGTLGMASMNGIVTVQGMDVAGQIAATSNFADPNIDVVGPGVGILGYSDDLDSIVATSGNSNATAITAGFLAVVESKYPKATSDQVLQSLIRNTGPDDHSLAKDPQNFWGYGAVSLQHMLRVDPSQYPDTNPFVATGGGYSPSYEQIYGSAPSADHTPPVSSSATPAAAGHGASNSGLSSWLLFGGIAVLVVIVAAVIVLVFLARSRSRKRSSAPFVSTKAPNNPVI